MKNVSLRFTMLTDKTACIVLTGKTRNKIPLPAFSILPDKHNIFEAFNGPKFGK